jgi:hypothetical protein
MTMSLNRINTITKLVFRTILIGLFILVSALWIIAQETNPVAQSSDDACGQTKAERDPLVQEAQREQFNVRRVEFAGSFSIRGRDLFKRVRMINEGDIFTRANLEAARKRLSRFGKIYPVTPDDIEIRLDRHYRSIDIVFCIKERAKNDQ